MLVRDGYDCVASMEILVRSSGCFLLLLRRRCRNRASVGVMIEVDGLAGRAIQLAVRPDAGTDFDQSRLDGLLRTLPIQRGVQANVVWEAPGDGIAIGQTWASESRNVLARAKSKWQAEGPQGATLKHAF